MCGIFGVLLRPGARLSPSAVRSLLERLYGLSESRGMESAGLHAYVADTGEAWTLKAPLRASALLRTRQYDDVIGAALESAFRDGHERPAAAVALLAHSRLVTNGTAERAHNNQPVRSGGVTVVHNGIVVNADDIWREEPGLTRRAEVDTEVVAALMDDRLAGDGDPAAVTSEVFHRIRGAASIAWLHERGSYAVLATNTGDLYTYAREDLGYLAFASERFILERAIGGRSGSNGHDVRWLPPGTALAVNLHGLELQPFPLNGGGPPPAWTNRPARLVRHGRHHDLEVPAPASGRVVTPTSADDRLLRYDEDRLRLLRRCSRCVLPETFPFIAFDDAGVCNYCRRYRSRYAGMDRDEALRRFAATLEPHRRRGAADAIVAFSGGRDSSYGLHLLKTELGLNPITFTFDWGMITDLARRNIARMCGALGVQNILVSADIRRKRENIGRNVAAWLRRPDLGVVPLFMAGDKEFLRVVNMVKAQTGIGLNIWSACPLENTDFKVGLCGIPPDFSKEHVDDLSMGRRVSLAAYYGRAVLMNPRYLNASVFDTAKAFWSYYFEPRRDYYQLFNHIAWDEETITRTLIGQYGWETAPDTASTWRIGDGTAAFYNYVYVTARGFSEFDTFRSNQIREGMLDRDAALALVLDENRPRPAALRWYLDTIGIDFAAAIRRINELDTHVRPRAGGEPHQSVA